MLNLSVLVCHFGILYFYFGLGQASFLILTDSKHNKYWKAEDACADQYGGELAFVSELSADQYLSVLDCLPYYQRFWIQREVSNNLDYNVCRKPYSFASSSFVNLECRLITGDAGTTYPCLCRTDQRPSDNDYGTICWRNTITTSPTTSSTSQRTPEVTTPEIHTTTSAQTNDSVIQTAVDKKKKQNGGEIAGAVLGVIFGLIVIGSIICLMIIWKKRRDLWDKYWCLKNSEPRNTGTQNEYDSVNASTASETHVYCGLNRSETGNTFLPTEDAYYSEPNTVNSSPRHSSGLQSPNIDNIHYIVMDNSINRPGNENAYSINVIDHSEQRENEVNEDFEQSLDSNMYHRLEPRNIDAEKRFHEQEPYYDLAHNATRAENLQSDSNINCDDQRHDVMDSNAVYELAQNV